MKISYCTIDAQFPKFHHEVPFQVINFPDGQQAVEFGVNLSHLHEAFIRTRLKSWKDLEVLVCATQTLYAMGVREINLEISYLLGARSDRRFSEYSCNYLKSVLAPVINSQKYRQVSVLDAHSDVTEAVIDNYRGVSNKFFIQSVLTIDKKNIALISPDAGALKKVYKIQESHPNKPPIIVATKHRDVQTGKITHTELPYIEEYSGRDLYIIDDICDGGRTFIEISKAVDAAGYKGKLYLVVTHGIFSAGLDCLRDYFDGIFCTNSYSDITDELEKDGFIKQIKVI